MVGGVRQGTSSDRSEIILGYLPRHHVGHDVHRQTVRQSADSGRRIFKDQPGGAVVAWVDPEGRRSSRRECIR